MSFKNFKSPTIRDPFQGLYVRTVDYLLSVREKSPDLYKLLDSCPQFEYEIHHYFNDQRSAQAYVNGLVRFLQEHEYRGQVAHGISLKGLWTYSQPTVHPEASTE